jgi:hypothetical protein
VGQDEQVLALLEPVGDGVKAAGLSMTPAQPEAFDIIARWAAGGAMAGAGARGAHGLPKMLSAARAAPPPAVGPVAIDVPYRIRRVPKAPPPGPEPVGGLVPPRGLLKGAQAPAPKAVGEQGWLEYLGGTPPRRPGGCPGSRSASSPACP